MKTCPNCGAAVPDDAMFCSSCAFNLGGAPPPGQAPPAPPGQPYQAQAPYPYPGQYVPHYAGFWIRFAAYFIDAVILAVAFIPINLLFWVLDRNIYFWGSWDWRGGVGIGVALLFNVIRVGVGWAYFTIMTGRYQATLGKMLLDIKVVGPDLGPISYTTAALREIVGKFVSSIVCGLGFIWIGFDERKQGWHDKIADTFVIYAK